MDSKVTWKLWYSEKRSGSYSYYSYSNLNGKPENAPALGVQILVLPHPSVGRYLAYGYDYYWYEFDIDEWMSGNEDGYKQYMYTPGIKTVKFGTVINNDFFAEILQVATLDTDFPRKSAYTRNERQHKAISEVVL